MCVPLVNHLKPQICSIEDIGPRGDNTILRANNGLIKIKTIEVKSHCRHAKTSEPNTNAQAKQPEKSEGCGYC